MKGFSPKSTKSSRKKGTDSPDSKIHKITNGISLLTMWKIQPRPKSGGDSVGDTVSPSKSLKLSASPQVSKRIEVESNSSNVDDQNLGYCPNCQMPFTALIKQSPNWHITECMDFDFQHMRECPSGESCSSTIESHYMKFTHYGLAKFRSGASKSPRISPSTKKIISPSRSENVLDGDFSPSPKFKKSSPKSASTPVSKSTSPRSYVGANMTPKSSATRAKKKCSPNGSISQKNSLLSSAAQYSGDQTKSPISSRISQGSPMISSTIKRKALPELDSENATPHEKLVDSTCGVDSVCDMSISGSSDPAKEIAFEQKCGKHPKHDGSVSCANNFLKSGNPFSRASNIREAETPGQNSDCKVGYESQAQKKRRLDSLYDKTSGSNHMDAKGCMNGAIDIHALAHGFFPDDVTDSIENSNVNHESEEELSIFRDASDVNKKSRVQTVITKTFSSSDNSFNMVLSPVKDDKLSLKKKVTTVSQPKNSNSSVKVELDKSPKKRQTSLNLFFKPSSSQATSTRQKKILESPCSVNKNGSFYIQQPVQSNGVRPVRKCPFYKKIPDTTFCVDAFNYGSIPGIQHYFLSHFHYDHYMGLTKGFHHPVYCSLVTANLVSLKIRLPSKFIHILRLNEAIVVDSVEVTALDANHCPGSVMFLFRFPDGRYNLHTGDFRATPAMELYPSLKNCAIERLYLDTTYCNPQYDFPSQDSVLQLMTSLIIPRIKSNAKLLVACGSYTIGKERAFMAIAECIDCKIWAQKSKVNVLKCLEDERISSRLVTDASLAKIHVLPMQTIKISELQQYLLKFRGVFDEIIGLKPTGWVHNSSGSNNIFSLKPMCQGPVTIYGVPYSEHSSFSELKSFVQFLSPRDIVPTVNVGNANSRKQMASYFEQWKVQM